MKKVLIIGAGASGLVAAIYAVKNGFKVTIVEKNEICGKKILATGNGRCNFWNEDQSISHYRSSDYEKIEEVLNAKNEAEILKLELNLKLKMDIITHIQIKQLVFKRL